MAGGAPGYPRLPSGLLAPGDRIRERVAAPFGSLWPRPAGAAAASALRFFAAGALGDDNGGWRHGRSGELRQTVSRRGSTGRTLAASLAHRWRALHGTGRRGGAERRGP